MLRGKEGELEKSFGALIKNKIMQIFLAECVCVDCSESKKKALQALSSTFTKV
jgi:hypothetical protein